MFTGHEIKAEIEELRCEEITQASVAALAGLLYISERFKACPETASDGIVEPLTQVQARSWVSGMENADGTTGAHWTMEKTEEVRKQCGIPCEPLEFWVAMNMIHSDYCKVAEKLGVNNLEFYACMAKAFLEDKDARPDKLARYHEYIAG